MNVQKIQIGLLAAGVAGLAVEIVGTIRERKAYKELKASYEKNLEHVDELQQYCCELVSKYDRLCELVDAGNKLIKELDDVWGKKDGSV